MVFERYYDRWRNFLLVCGVIILVVFFVVFQPLNRRAEALDAELESAWQELHSWVGSEMNYPALSDLFQQIQESSESIRRQRRELERRFALSPELQRALETPFQLVDFEEQRFMVAGEIGRLAIENSVHVDASVESNLPNYSSDLESPAWLWAQLEYARQLLLLAITNHVASIHSLRLLPPRDFANDPERGPDWREFRIRLHLSGPAESLHGFLASLPLRTEAIAKSDLPTAPDGKPEMCLNHLVLKRAEDAPEAVSLDILVGCYLRYSPVPVEEPGV